MTDRAFPKPIFDDDEDRRQERLARQAEAREGFRLKVREKLPTVTAYADAVRAVFGDDTRIIWAVEDGHAVGKVPDAKRAEYEEAYGPLKDLKP